MTTDPTSITPSTTRLSVLNRQQKVAGGSMVVVAIAAFLPWVSIFGLSVSGIEGDGQITLAAALAGLAALAFGTDVIGRRRLPRPAYLAITGIGAALTAVIGIYDMNGFAAIGLYATMFAGIVWAAAVVWEIVERRRAS